MGSGSLLPCLKYLKIGVIFPASAFESAALNSL
jgi:hypothetical protein